jgi:PTH1 family peptidyl-tRNA hydrolase
VKLIVGLGNPGERYRRTRHNVGFMVVDALAGELSAERWHTQAESLVAAVALPAEPDGTGGGPALLVKPQTFMNRSGFAVAQLVAAHGLRSEDALVIVDDVVIDLGTLRMRERGGHGGHNGLRSIIECLGTEDFPRLRIGVRKGEQEGDLADYVLAPFPEEEVLVVQEVVGYAVEATLCALAHGTAEAMTRYNKSVLQQ